MLSRLARDGTEPEWAFRIGHNMAGLNVTEAGDLVGPCAADALGKRRTFMHHGEPLL